MAESTSHAGDSHLILLVDDEQSVLHALKRLLRREDYTILTAGSGDEALELLANSERPIGVVISDFRMPGMNGVELLTRVRVRYPDTFRIILSGYADAEVVQAAINEGWVYRFVSKPWDDEDLKAVIRASVQQYEAARVTQAVLERVSTLRNGMREVGKATDQMGPRAASASVEWVCPIEDCPERAAVGAWQEILNAIPAALLGVDCDELVVFANAQVQQVFSLNRLAILGASASEVLPPDLVGILRLVVRSDCDGKRAVVSLHGRSFTVECVPLHGTEGKRRRGAILCALATGEVA